jgi:hypothetical protein
LILEAEADLVPMGPRSPLRSGRRRADIPRMSCAPSSARLRLLWGRCLWFKVSPPARSARGMRSPGPHSVSAPLRSLQNRRPPDVLQPIFRMASVVAWQAPHGSKVSAPLRSAQNRRPPDVLQHIFRTPSSALKWGKLNYTDFVQNCILDQKERTSL